MVHDVLQGIAADAVLLHQLPIEVGHLYFVFLEAGTPLGAVLTPEEFLQAVTDLSLTTASPPVAFATDSLTILPGQLIKCN